MGPSRLPCIARDTPIPEPIIRKVPQKKVSPIPDRGPMRATLMALMEFTSKSGLAQASSSMAATIPSTKGEQAKVLLYTSEWREQASANFSLSSP